MAMKAVCDMCGASVDVGPFGSMPAGWFRVIQFVPAPDPDTQKDVCSYPCMVNAAAFSSAQDKAARIAAESQAQAIAF